MNLNDKIEFSDNKILLLDKKLSKAKKVVITSHKSPDGDSVGSSLALYLYLTKKGINVTVCHPDAAPPFLNWLFGFDKILNLEEGFIHVEQLINDADIIFCLDYNALNRTGNEMEEMIQGSGAYRIMIDHHLYPSDEFDLSFSDIQSCSTAQLIFDFIVALGDRNLIDVKMGEAIYCGIMTDSGSFRFPSTTPHTHEVIAELLRIGVSNAKVHEAVFDTNTTSRLKLRGYAIDNKLEVLEYERTAIMSLTKSELIRYNYQKGDTEGLVNVGLSILGVEKSIFLSEGNGYIKMSFRSKGEDNPINEMASKYFHGGGHANASGGKFEGTIEEAIAEVKRVLPEFKK